MSFGIGFLKPRSRLIYHVSRFLLVISVASASSATCDPDAYCAALVSADSYCKTYQSTPTCAQSSAVIPCGTCGVSDLSATTASPSDLAGGTTLPTVTGSPQCDAFCKDSMVLPVSVGTG